MLCIYSNVIYYFQHSMKVVFLCNRLSRTKLRGSLQAMLEACHKTQEIHFARENNLLTADVSQTPEREERANSEVSSFIKIGKI